MKLLVGLVFAMYFNAAIAAPTSSSTPKTAQSNPAPASKSAQQSNPAPAAQQKQPGLLSRLFGSSSSSGPTSSKGQQSNSSPASSQEKKGGQAKAVVIKQPETQE